MAGSSKVGAGGSHDARSRIQTEKPERTSPARGSLIKICFAAAEISTHSEMQQHVKDFVGWLNEHCV